MFGLWLDMDCIVEMYGLPRLLDTDNKNLDDNKNIDDNESDDEDESSNNSQSNHHNDSDSDHDGDSDVLEKHQNSCEKRCMPQSNVRARVHKSSSANRAGPRNVVITSSRGEDPIRKDLRYQAAHNNGNVPIHARTSVPS